MAKEAEVDQLDEDLENPLELTSKKDVLFIPGDWDAKVKEKSGVRGTLQALENKMKRGKG